MSCIILHYYQTTTFDRKALQYQRQHSFWILEPKVLDVMHAVYVGKYLLTFEPFCLQGYIVYMTGVL